ncbi:MAG: 3-demethylubiquinone-9 3-O-methyltransferase [Proteobacteria bacterium]|nr:3-demethylubiquinone-9 3-O-methyltransferase [Pseudomonadota bacterium]
MPKPHKAVANLSRNLRQPRAGTAIYGEYNTLRQLYVLESASAHFHVRDDDPAPLFGKTLLDVGCGESTIAEFLALSGADITAVDQDAAVLARARASAEKYGAPVTFLHTSAEKLIQSHRKFDVILALDLLEDSTNPRKLLWVLRQLLAPGGVIIFSCINRSFKAWFFHILVSTYLYRRTSRNIASFWRFYTPRQLQTLCHHAQLQLTNVQGLRFSLSKQKWKYASQPHTRYLATAVQAQADQ